MFLPGQPRPPWSHPTPGLKAGREGRRHPFRDALEETQRNLVSLAPRGSSWPTGWKRPQIDLAGLRVASLDDRDGRSWFQEDWVNEDGIRFDKRWNEGGRSFEGLSRRHRAEKRRWWDPTVQLILSGFEYDRIGDLETARKKGTKETLPWTPELPRTPDGSFQRRLLAARQESVSVLRRLRVGSASYLRRLVLTLRGSVLLLLKPRSLSAGLRSLPGRLRSWSQSDSDPAPWQERLDSRRNWLNAQYATPDRPNPVEYNPQPYQQLARVWRSQGDYGAADDVTFNKLRLERVVLSRWRLTRWLKYWAFELPFGYGLRTYRALLTFAFFVALGSALISLGLSVSPLGTSVMVVDASNIGMVASGSAGSPSTVVPLQQPPTSRAEFLCLGHIDPPLYALDVLVPVLDLRRGAEVHDFV